MSVQVRRGVRSPWQHPWFMFAAGWAFGAALMWLALELARP